MMELNERYLIYLIEKIKEKCKDLDYVDIITEIMEEHNIDAEDIVLNLPKSLIEKIKIDFVNRNMVKNEKLRNTLF